MKLNVSCFVESQPCARVCFPYIGFLTGDARMSNSGTFPVATECKRYAGMAFKSNLRVDGRGSNNSTYRISILNSVRESFDVNCSNTI